MMHGALVVANKAYDRIARRHTAPAQTTQAHTRSRSVSAVAFFTDGRRVITGSWDTLRIWDVQKRTFVGRPFEGHRGWVQSVAVSPDDKQIASGGDDFTIIIWDSKSQQMVFDPMVTHTDMVNSVCFSPDGKKLASGSSDSTVVLWDPKTGIALAILEHRNSVLSVAFSADGLKLASGSYDQVIRVWRTDNTELLLETNAHHDCIGGVVWSFDGQQIISASYDTTVQFSDSANGYQIGQPWTGRTPWRFNSLVISSDGSFIATTAFNDNTVQLWSTKSHRQIGQALEHTAKVACIAISPNGGLLVSGDYQGEVRLWSMENTLSAASQLYSSSGSYFAHRSKVNLRHKLYSEALSDAEKVIELNPSSHLGYELKHAALHGAQRYVEVFVAFKTTLSKLENASDPKIRKLRQRYTSPSEADGTIRGAIHARLENAPLRLINTSTGYLCNRDAQINAFTETIEYQELLSSSVMHASLQMELIKEAIAKYFSWVMLSHRWERKEPLLHEIQDKAIYKLDPVGTVVKLQKFCEVARDAGYSWAWVDTCCIDQNNNVELQESVNSMFVWYRHSALTIIYLSDVPRWPPPGALANSTWNTRGWTVQEFLAPNIVLFYQADWSLYIDVRSPNHKESVAIMQELERSTGINAQALVAFRPGMRGAREKLQWASGRVTTLQEDIAYSLFGIFGVHLPVIYGEKRQNALGRLLQEIIAHSGDISALDWVGKSSDFNSCLPAYITSYKAPPCTLPSLSEDDIEKSVSILQHTVIMESASKLYTLLENLSAPRFANSRLQLPCIAFPVTEVRRRLVRDHETCFTYDIKAEGLQDLLITTEDKLIQFSPARPIRQTFLLIRPWNRYDLDLPDFSDDMRSADDWLELGSSSDDFFGRSRGDNEPVDSDSHTRELRLLVRLGQPFGALFLAQQRGGEYKRIASDNNIIASVKDVASVGGMMDVRTLEIL